MPSYAAVKFDGGMNDWLHPSLLADNVAGLLVNAEVDDGKISPLRRPEAMTVHDPESYGHFGTRDRSVIKWYDRFYWSDNTATAPPWYGGNVENYLGIPYPVYFGPEADVEIASIAPDEGEAGLEGRYRYCVCFVNPNGWEGAPGSLEEYEIAGTLAGQWAEIIVTWDDTRIDYAKIYRTGNLGADFYCVGEIRASGGALVDKTDDATLTMLNPLTSADNYPPPERGRYLCESGGVFFLAEGSRLWFSAQGNPHAWPPLNFIAVDDTITGMVPEFQGILVCTRNHAFRVVGAESPETVTKMYLPGNHGCSNFRSIASINNSPVWLSNDGICLWNGESVAVPSYRVIHTEFLQVKYAVSAHDKYYLFLVDGAIVFDRRNGDIFYRADFTCDYAWYDGDFDALYMLIDGRLYQYGRGHNLNFTYRSGHIGASELTVKIFEEAVVSCDGKAVLTVTLDDRELFTVELAPGRRRVKFPRSAVGRYVTLKLKSNAALKEFAVIYQ